MTKLSIFEYGLMANDVYLDEKEPMLPTLTAYGWGRLVDDETKKHRAGFYARLYYNPIFDHYVIAFRGTSFSSPATLLADAQYTTGHKPKIYQQAVIFYAELLENLSDVENPQAQISFTGHSLGGIIAKILAVETGVRAVAFNAPGIAKVSGANGKNKYPHIINVNSEKGLINKVGNQVGKEYKLDLLHGNLACKAPSIMHIPLMRVQCIADKHKMVNVLDAVKHHPELSYMRH